MDNYSRLSFPFIFHDWENVGIYLIDTDYHP